MANGELTHWLSRLKSGETDALDQLLPRVYDELRSLAKAQLRKEDTGHTLGATALVHEAYLRLADRHQLDPQDRHHFFAIAAQAMRRVLIDHARTRKRKKRGSGKVALSLEHAGALLADDGAEELLALDRALDRLAAANPRAAQVVERRFFAGLTLEETATSLGVSLKTVQRDWLLARAWLQNEIGVERADDTTVD
ncbi:MAG: ECF-type sigma factor [Gemmatimonadota bacterium]